MDLGKCPICDNKIEIYKSLDIDDFKRYDIKCDTEGCLINHLEWNYEKRDKLIARIASSQKMVNERISLASKPRSHKATKVHYESRGKSLCGQGSNVTDAPEKVTCGNCKIKPTFILLSKHEKVS